MLIIEALEDIPSEGVKKGDEFSLYIVDAHHHMGKEGKHRNTPATAYEFYIQLWFQLQKMAKRMLSNDELRFKPLRVEAPPLPHKLYSLKEPWQRMNHGWLVDRTVVFPYTDDYSKADFPNQASFKISNDRIAGWSTRAPHSARLIGFARVDPQDAEKGSSRLAVKELERAIKTLGLRGLKLHPLAQLFLEDIESRSTIEVVKKAGELGIPVLFDTRNIKTIESIRGLIESMRADRKCSKALNGLRIILAHCGMNPGDKRLYDILRNPLFFGETSTMHGKDIPVLFGLASERLKGLDSGWSSKIMFGTDYSFLTVQAVELIIYLLSREFPGTLTDVQRILGGNSLQLIQRPFRTDRGAKTSPKHVTFRGDVMKARAPLEDAIFSSLTTGDIDLLSLDFMLPPRDTWPNLQSRAIGGYNGVHLESVLFSILHKEKGEESHIWLRENMKEVLTFSSMGTQNSSSIVSMDIDSQSENTRLLASYRTDSIHAESIEELLSVAPSILVSS
jgi:predicted TIM-barrel fold metal-dependent hydrolase